MEHMSHEQAETTIRGLFASYASSHSSSQVRAIFDLLDHDRDGYVLFDDLKGKLSSLSSGKITDDSVLNQVNARTRNDIPSGWITFQEFEAVCQQAYAEQEEADLEDLFG